MEKFNDYFKSIGFSTNAIFEKVTPLFDICAKFCPEEIQDVFVSEYRNSDDSIVYESLFLFSDNFLIEIRNPLGSEFSWDFSSLYGNIQVIDIKSLFYDYYTPDEKSRLTIDTASSTNALISRYKASGLNCSKLWTIANKYLKNRLTKQFINP
jgi:hypothetical protein